MAREMIGVPYDALWLEMYEREKNILLDPFGDSIIDIQHFGSTVIRGMRAN